ncbi:MAG: putative glycoside hydrolase [Fervidobacterium sp.]|nr:putative glycoside hydrolase [Fervidobacterium sp.]
MARGEKLNKKKEQKQYAFLNKIYKLSQQGKLTWKRMNSEKFGKLALKMFLISVIISVSLFTYIFFISWSEKAFAKKSLDLLKQQTVSEKTVEATPTTEEATKTLAVVQEPQKESSSTNQEYLEILDSEMEHLGTHVNATNTPTPLSYETPKTSVKDKTQKESAINSRDSQQSLNSSDNTDTTLKNPEPAKSPKPASEEPIKTSENLILITQEPTLTDPDKRLEELSQKTSEKLNPKINSIDEYAFVSTGGVLLFDSLETRNVVGKVRYGTFVKIVEEKELEGEKYSYVIYYDKKDPESPKQGWIKSLHITPVAKYVTSNPKDISLQPRKKFAAKVQNVRGIYLSRATASNKDKLKFYVEFLKRNNLNAFVIDVKDDDGMILFKSDVSVKYSPDASKFTAYTKQEIREILNDLKAQGVYLIARIVCFKDPTYARTHMDRAIVFKDTGEPYMGVYKVPWASAYDRELWQYNIEIAKEAIEVGFDEIQYDYVRFPELTKAVKERVNLRQKDNETMAEAIYKFLLRSKQELEPYGVPLTADIFGLVSSVIDDLGIGQHWEMISSVIDYVCPMVYPSHYANGCFNLPVPDAYPYETVYNSVLDGIVRNKYLHSPARIRPWIQSFTATWVKGHIKYGEEEIRKQIKALEDLGINEYMLWNASNNYIEMKYD